MGQALESGVNPLPHGNKLYGTSIHHYYLVITAPKEAIRSIIPIRAGVNSRFTLNVLISLLFKPQTRNGLMLSFNTGANSMNRRIDYLMELGYLKQERFYWWSSAVNSNNSAIRYSVTSKGEKALRQLLDKLGV